MATAHSIFTLGGGFKFFLAAFDLALSVVALKVDIGLKKLFLGVSINYSRGPLDRRLPALTH